MYKWIPIVFLSLATTITFAQTAYVAAPRGLKLRKMASPTGEVVKTLPYGTKLSTVKDTKPKVEHKTKEAEGFYLKGFWQKVAAGKDTGYVFDAFLLPFEPFTYGDFEHIANTFDIDTIVDPEIPTEVHLLESRFDKGGKLFDVVKYKPGEGIYVKNKKSPYAVKSFKQTFASGNITLSYSAHANDGGFYELIFKNLPLSYAYTFALSLAYSDDYGVFVDVNYLNNSIIVAGTCYYEIYNKGNQITVKQECGC